MICPFLSTTSKNSNEDNLYPCIGSCALFVDKTCAIKILAQSQKQNSNDKNN